MLGEDGEAAVDKVLSKAKEMASQPADVMRMVESYLKGLGDKVALRELSSDLEKGYVEERMTQLKTMEAEVDRL